MTWFRLPLFIWSTYATSLINVLGTPVIVVTILLVAWATWIDRHRVAVRQWR